MPGDGREDTALNVARARFVEGLPRKAGELRGAVAVLAEGRDSSRPREDLRRRLHALYASAQVFQLAAISESLKDAIQRLDDARDQGRALSQEEVSSFGALADK